MSVMRTVGVMFCRNRGPRSQIGPYMPLPIEEWDQFQRDVRAALERHIPGGLIEPANSVTEWAGRVEPAVVLTRVWADYTPYRLEALRVALGELAYRYDQDSIAVIEGQRTLAMARPT